MENGTPTTPLPSSTPPSAQGSFPPIKDLFVESWHLLVSRLLRFFLFGLLSMGMGIALFIILAIIGGSTLYHAALPFLSHKGDVDPAMGAAFMRNLPALLGTIYLLGVVFIIGIIVLSTIHTAWTFLILREDTTVSFGTIFRKGFSYMLPLFLVGLLTTFFVWGGFFFFIIPAMLFSIFFAFAEYEVVLDGQTNLNALKRSYTIITGHFGEIFVRFFLLNIGFFILQMLPRFFMKSAPEVATSLSGLLVIVGFFFGWYSLCYGYLIYKQAKERTDFSRPVSLTWMWIVAILGWVILLFVGLAISNGISQFVQSGGLQKMIDESQKSSQTTHDTNNYYYNTQVSPTTGNTTNNYTYPTTAPTVDYNAKLQQQEQQAQQMQKQMQQDYQNAVQSHPTP